MEYWRHLESDDATRQRDAAHIEITVWSQLILIDVVPAAVGKWITLSSLLKDGEKQLVSGRSVLDYGLNRASPSAVCWARRGDPREIVPRLVAQTGDFMFRAVASSNINANYGRSNIWKAENDMTVFPVR